MSKAGRIRLYHADSDAKQLDNGVEIKTTKDLVQEINPAEENDLDVKFSGQKDPEHFYHLERVSNYFLMNHKPDSHHTFSFRLEGSGTDYKIVMTPEHADQIDKIRKARGQPGADSN